ncbi:hypothetical protein BKA56DRAFT_591831 [Ilyonectria sp. MPI-CAGE-AT-0026]|nr:hypothetical protein BKA56DRAFT_591831 [Ilyonectria sp. MPI-CAGE-AT-0026]
MGQGRLSTELGLSFFAVFCYCWMLAISCVFIVMCVSYGDLGWDTRLIHLISEWWTTASCFKGQGGWAWWALGRRKGDEAPRPHLEVDIGMNEWMG